MNDLLQNHHSGTSGPVECLGQTFASDDTRRAHFLTLLAEKLQDPTFRKQEGFPKGSDAAILAMSDPPYYTACPNPWLAEFVAHYGKPYDPAVKYSREPLEPMTQGAAAEALQVSERAVRTARAVLADGAPALVEAVARGSVSLHAAEAVALRPAEEQAEIVARGRGEILAAAKRYRAEEQAQKAQKRAEKERALGEKIAAGADALAGAAAAGKRYGVLYADPEWRFEPWSRETGMDRAPENHYPTSPLDDIKARPVADVAADDAVLFLWATAPMLPEALAVMAAWGFAYKSHFVWDKARLGTGYWNRNRHELLLLGTRGAVPAPAMGTQWPSLFAETAGAHSAKPDAAYDLIEQYFPTLPKLELNARKARPGWDAWGAEAPETE